MHGSLCLVLIYNGNRQFLLELPVFYTSPSVTAFLRKRKEIHHRPDSPTMVYTNRLNREPEPPKSHATRSKPKIPTSPQFRQPTMDRIRAMVSIIIPPFHFTDVPRICILQFFISRELKKSGLSVIIMSLFMKRKVKP